MQKLVQKLPICSSFSAAIKGSHSKSTRWDDPMFMTSAGWDGVPQISSGSSQATLSAKYCSLYRSYITRARLQDCKSCRCWHWMVDIQDVCLFGHVSLFDQLYIMEGTTIVFILQSARSCVVNCNASLGLTVNTWLEIARLVGEQDIVNCWVSCSIGDY